MCIVVDMHIIAHLLFFVKYFFERRHMLYNVVAPLFCPAKIPIGERGKVPNENDRK